MAYREELYARGRGRDLWAPLKAALFTKDKFERKNAVGATVEGLPRHDPRGPGRAEGRRSRRSSAARGGDPARRGARRAHPLRQPRGSTRSAPIEIEVGVLPRTHGSALFTRGETQALASVTLGTRRDAQIIEEYEGETMQKFLLHYNFPPFSVGEVKFMRGPPAGARSATACWRAAPSCPVLPHEDDFPYTDPRRLGHPGVERLVVDGHGLRRLAGAVRRRRADAGAGRRRRDGPDQGRRAASRCSPTSPARKTTTATWTSRSPARARASPLCRWTSRSPASIAEIMEQGARAGEAPAGSHILDKMERAMPQAAPRDLSTFAPRLLHAADPEGQDPRHHRTRWQDDPLDRRGDRLRDRGRERRPGDHRLARRRGGAKRAIEMIERLTEVPEVGKIYTGTGAAGRGLRRLRRDPAGHRRPGPHQRARPLPRPRGDATWSRKATRSPSR